MKSSGLWGRTEGTLIIENKLPGTKGGAFVGFKVSNGVVFPQNVVEIDLIERGGLCHYLVNNMPQRHMIRHKIFN